MRGDLHDAAQHGRHPGGEQHRPDFTRLYRTSAAHSTRSCSRRADLPGTRSDCPRTAANGPQTPLIILYYRGVPFEAAEATRLGITDQLRSPATRKRLLRVIEHALGSRRSATVEAPESIEPAVTRVLIVEDDPASARAVEMSLEEIGCLVRSARSADEALAALEAAPADIAFVDRSLPGMDGIELTRRIRSLPGGAAEMRIIALSGSSSEETRNQFFSAGADDCLVKPASREQLQHAIYWTQTARR